MHPKEADGMENSVDPRQTAPFDWGQHCEDFNRNIFVECRICQNYRRNSKIWDTSNNCHNCPKNRKV